MDFNLELLTKGKMGMEINNEKRFEIISKYKAVDFIQKYHYSKIMPKLTKYYLGFYEGKNLLGVITLGWGTQPLQTIKKIFYKHNVLTKDYLEIGKMCFTPEMNNNSYFGSKIMKYLISWIKQNTDISFLYTLADGIMGKVGYVYQACSFIYLGSFETQVYIDNNTGEKIHPRSAKTLLRENAIYEEKEKLCWLTHDFCKEKNIDKIVGLMFRYITPLNKKSRKIIMEYKEYQNNKYPKENDLVFKKRLETNHYEQTEKPLFDMDYLGINSQRVQTQYQTDIYDFNETW